MNRDKTVNKARGKSKSLLAIWIFALIFTVVLIPFAVLSAKQGRWKDAVGALASALFACSVVFILTRLTRGDDTGAKELEKMSAENPDAPWLWRKDWAAGHIEYTPGNKLWITWTMAVIWNGFSWFAVYQWLTGNLHGQGDPRFILVFPIAGVVIIVVATVATVRAKKYGKSVLRLLRIPASPGGVLHGVVEVGLRLRAETGVSMRLCCVHRYCVQSGRKTETREEILWEDEKVLRNELPESRAGKSDVPIFFQIPNDARETDTDGGILWRLLVSAQVPGLDYCAEFEVPLFHSVAAKSQSVPAMTVDPTAAFQVPAEKLQATLHSRIQIRPTHDGGKEFFFPAGRNRSMAVILTLLALALLTGLVLVIWFKPNLIAIIAFGVMGAFFSALSVNLWFRESRIVVETSGIAVTDKWLLFQRRRHFSAQQISDLAVEVGIQSNTQSFHDIKLELNDGRKITLGSALESKREAEWLTEQMLAALSGK